MKTIRLSTGAEALVDDEDFDYLISFRWSPAAGGYACTQRFKRMHRLIMNAKPGEIVDHIDRNKLNNTKANLRIVNIQMNSHNQQKRIGTKNNFKGVAYVKRLNSFQARCRIGKDYFLGYFKSEIAAAYAYNKKASELSNCILLNNLPYSKDVLEQMLIIDRVKMPEAEKKSGVKGVYWNKSKNLWEVIVMNKGKRINLGCSTSLDNAIMIRKRMAI